MSYKINPFTGQLDDFGQASKVNGFSAADMIFFGDSRMRGGPKDWLCTAQGSGTSGVEVCGFEKPAETLLADIPGSPLVGSLDFDGPNKMVRWAAPEDVAGANYGPWTRVRPLEQLWLESGTPKRRLKVAGRRSAAWNTQTNSVTITINNNNVNVMLFRAQLSAALGVDPYSIPVLAAGGEFLDSVSEAIDWAASEYPTRKLWVVWAGCNNTMTGGALVASGVAAAASIAAKAKQYGATVLWVGNYCQWGAAENTPLIPQNITDLKTIETAIRSTVNSSDRIYYADVLPLSMDRSDTTNSFKPLVSPYLLLDTVHPTQYAGQIFAEKIISDFGQLFAKAPTPGYFDGNKFKHGLFNVGTGAASGTGITGTFPTGWAVTRISGDANTVCSVVDNPYGPGKALKLDITATSASQVSAYTNNAGNQSLTALGKGGDTLFNGCFEVADLTANADVIECRLMQYNSTPAVIGANYTNWIGYRGSDTLARNFVKAFAGRKRFYGTPRKLEPTCVYLYPWVDILVPAGYSGSLLITFVGIY